MRLATGDKATIVVERQIDGKMRVTSGSWDSWQPKADIDRATPEKRAPQHFILEGKDGVYSEGSAQHLR